MTASKPRGRITATATVTRDLRRKLNAAAGALAEKTLAKALTGDSTAQLACAELLSLANGKKATSP